MLLLALSTGNKLGLGLSAAVFAGFSLVVSMLVPRWRPQFPGRWLPGFLVVSVALFIGMVMAVVIFGRSSEEAAAEPSGQEHQQSSTQEQQSRQQQQHVTVRESEFKIQLPKTSLTAGAYTFAVSNVGKLPHDFVVAGPDGKKGTTTISPGGSATLTVALKKGSYDFYCSIPGHKQAGMDQTVTVS